MNDLEFSDEVRQLIASSVPNLDALEVLMFLARHPEQTWTAADLDGAVRPMKSSELRQYLILFVEQGLISASPPDGFQYRPRTPALESAAIALRKAYDERPVTLIRTVHAIGDLKKIQSFADAFKLKKDS